MTARCALLMLAWTVAWGGIAAQTPQPELTSSDPDSWIGKTKEELLEKWGKPAKSRQRKGGQQLVFSKDVLVGYSSLDDPTSASISFEKDEDGKSKPTRRSGATVPLYKKMKFKFRLDAEGRVISAEFPPEARTDPTGKVYGAQPEARPPT